MLAAYNNIREVKLLFKMMALFKYCLVIEIYIDGYILIKQNFYEKSLLLLVVYENSKRTKRNNTIIIKVNILLKVITFDFIGQSHLNII